MANSSAVSEPLPPIRYTQAGDVDIAYRVVGDGPIDLVWVPGLISNLEIEWEDHVKGGLYRRLAGFSRLITFDKRGMGLSDRSVGAPTLEDRMDDVRAVMDAVGSERAALIGNSEGGFMTQLFAAFSSEGASVYFPGAPFLAASLLLVVCVVLCWLILGAAHRRGSRTVAR